MRISKLLLIALANDTPIGYDDGTHHRVWSCPLNTVSCQLNAALHESLVVCHLSYGGQSYEIPAIVRYFQMLIFSNIHYLILRVRHNSVWRTLIFYQSE